jgi:hypothetical protein
MKRQLSNAVNSRHGRIILLSRGGVRNTQIAQRCAARPAGSARSSSVSMTAATAARPLAAPKQLIGMSVWSLPSD